MEPLGQPLHGHPLHGQPFGRRRETASHQAGELILENGRHSGTTRALVAPLTLLGRASHCDIRLNVEGIEPVHCLLTQGPEGWILRDLDSGAGTFLNGERAHQEPVADGDILNIGPFQFRLRLPEVVQPPEDDDSFRDPLRLQVAAVAAQQIALTEEEMRLNQRRAALEQQEEQLAAHLEEKRRKLVLLSERAQAERVALEEDRANYEHHIEKVTGDLTQTQRDLLDSQQKVQAERKRLIELQKRIRQRWHRFWFAERQKFNQREEGLQAEARALQEVGELLNEREKTLTEKRLRFHALYEVGRRHLREAWQRLRQDQYRWKHRRGKERAALKVRERDMEAAERTLLEAQRLFLKEKHLWDTTKTVLETELQGLETRVRNQRLKVMDQQEELARLQANIFDREQELAEMPEAAPPVKGENTVPLSPEGPLPEEGKDAPAKREEKTTVGPKGEAGTASSEKVSPERLKMPAAAPPVLTPEILAQHTRRGRSLRQHGKKTFQALLQPPPQLPAPAPEAKSEPLSPQVPENWQERFRDLDRLAGELADQRCQLVEQWQRLGLLHAHWEQDRGRATQELEELARRLVEKGHLLAEREQAGQQADQVLRQRHEELLQIRQQMIAWRARLRVREKAWEGERRQLLTELKAREDLTDQHMNTLVDLRHRWAKRRRLEMEKLREDRTKLEVVRKEFGQQRLQLAEQVTALEEEKRILAEKALTLEVYRKEFLSKVENPAAERRIERLRRRWLTQNAATIRAATRERETLKNELVSLENRHADLQKRADALSRAEFELAEKMTAWEHKQALAATRQTRLQHELQNSEAQKKLFEQQLVRMKEEIERIARSLIDEPDPPTSMGLSRAA